MLWPFEKLVITYAKWMKETSKPCSTCGSPVPDCYALCFVCLNDRQRRRIAKLEAALNNQITDTALAEVKMEELEAAQDYSDICAIELEQKNRELEAKNKKQAKLIQSMQKQIEWITEGE